MNNLQTSLNNKNREIENLKKENSDLNDYINNLTEQNNIMNNKILYLSNQTKYLEKNKKSNLDHVDPDEKILSVQFKSTDHIIDLCLPCKNTDIFVRLEEQLYERYPEYKETNNIFLCNGNIIIRFKSLEDNKIKNSDKILLDNDYN